MGGGSPTIFAPSQCEVVCIKIATEQTDLSAGLRVLTRCSQTRSQSRRGDADCARSFSA